MTPLKLPSLAWRGWDWAAIGVLTAIIGAVLLWWLVMVIPAHDRRDKVQARAGEAVAVGAAKAAQDAQAVVIDQARADTAIAALTEEVQREIDSASNAKDDAGAAGLRGLRGLCERPAHRNEQRCRQLLETRP